MPILDIEIVLRHGEILLPDLAARLAEAAGEIFGSSPGRTWVKLRSLPPEQYAEDGDGPPPGVYPVFVSVLKAERPDGEMLRLEAGSLARAIGQVCNRPAENVHILYEADAKGRLAFGGEIIPS